MSCIIRITSNNVRYLHSTIYEVNSDLPVYFIDETGNKIMKIENKNRVHFPTFEIADTDKNVVNEKILSNAATLAYSAGYLGVVHMDVISKMKIKGNEKDPWINVIEMAMFYMPEDKGIYDFEDLPREVDLCDYYPDASIENMKNMWTVIDIMNK
jgi:hypothetical protein